MVGDIGRSGYSRFVAYKLLYIFSWRKKGKVTLFWTIGWDMLESLDYLLNLEFPLFFYTVQLFSLADENKVLQEI
jgi:hypothetical protein